MKNDSSTSNETKKINDEVEEDSTRIDFTINTNLHTRRERSRSQGPFGKQERERN